MRTLCVANALLASVYAVGLNPTDHTTQPFFSYFPGNLYYFIYGEDANPPSTGLEYRPPTFSGPWQITDDVEESEGAQEDELEQDEEVPTSGQCKRHDVKSLRLWLRTHPDEEATYIHSPCRVILADGQLATHVYAMH